MIAAFLFTAILFFVLGQHLPNWLRSVLTAIQNERLLSKILPTEVDSVLLCKEPHKWTLVVDGLDENAEFTHINVCTNCGFIPSMNVMATKEGLDYIEKNQQHAELEKKMVDDFVTMEKEGIERHFTEELKNGLEFRKLEQVYMAGQSMKERFIMYKLHKTQPNKEEASDGRRS